MLILTTRSRRPRLAAAARLAVFLVPLGLALSLRAHHALTAADVLDWDETYYLNSAVTAARGHGLYPYIFGYAPMPVLGGFGYAGYLNALAVLVAGPSLVALRVLSLLASAAGLAAIWTLTRTWYGTGAAWAATAITSTAALFMLSNTARMDSWTFAWVAWALVLFARAIDRPDRRWRHAVAGLAFGLGLQIHPDVVVSALACGVIYVVMWAGTAFTVRRLIIPVDALLFLAGWGAGLLLFVAANVLPDPAAFYKTTLSIRVDATEWYSGGTRSVTASFLDPRILLAKETVRYRLLASVVPAAELLLAAVAIGAAVMRRAAADAMVLVLVAATLAATAIVLNNAAPVYFIHVAPILFVLAGPLFSHGVDRRANVALAQIGRGRLFAFAVVIAALSAINEGRLLRAIGRGPSDDTAASAFAQRVRAVAEPRCKVAGDATLYVRHFPDYPYFISTRRTEVRYAMMFFDAGSELEYWTLKRPDVVFGPGPLPDALATYVSANGFVERAAGVWSRREGCAGGP